VQLNVVGSVVGTLKDVEECLDFTARGIVRPILTKGKFSDLDDLIPKMKHGKLVGRAVVECC
jgi:alcohol dehydrogenase, propanol-preferring